MKRDKPTDNEFPKEIAIVSVEQYGKALIVRGIPVENMTSPSRGH